MASASATSIGSKRSPTRSRESVLVVVSLHSCAEIAGVGKALGPGSTSRIPAPVSSDRHRTTRYRLTVLPESAPVIVTVQLPAVDGAVSELPKEPPETFWVPRVRVVDPLRS